MSTLSEGYQEVDAIIGRIDSAQQLDPEPQENQKMSPLRRAREEEYLNGEVHGIGKRSFSEHRNVSWNRYWNAVRVLTFTRKPW